MWTRKSRRKTRFWKLITGLWRRERIGYRLRETDPQSFMSRFCLFHTVLLQCFLQALPAAGAWLIIGLIRVCFHCRLRNESIVKGDFYTCALWPEEIDCIPLTGENVTKAVKACHIPKTFTWVQFDFWKFQISNLIKVILKSFSANDDCVTMYARNLRATRLWESLTVWLKTLILDSNQINHFIIRETD